MPGHSKKKKDRQMSEITNIVRDTIENHLGDLCPIEDGEIDEAIDLVGGDITPTTVEEAFLETLGVLPEDFDARLFEDISSALLEDCAGVLA